MNARKHLKVLIVDKDEQLVMETTRYFSARQVTCTPADTLSTAMKRLSGRFFDSIVLELNLPDGSGFSLLEKAKRLNHRGSIIAISRFNSLSEKILSLNNGADDYLTKPVSLNLLEARIRNLARALIQNKSAPVSYHELVLKPDEHEAIVNRTQLHLTFSEYSLLFFFVTHAQKVISRNRIGAILHNGKADVENTSNFVHSHIKNLRKKIAEVSDVNYLKTVRGKGYVLSAE